VKKRKREEEKKGGEPHEADFMCGAHVPNGAFYDSWRGSIRDSHMDGVIVLCTETPG
jgi:hypothetical protein